MGDRLGTPRAVDLFSQHDEIWSEIVLKEISAEVVVVKRLIIHCAKRHAKNIPFKTTNYACGIYIEQVLIICVHFSSRDLFLSRVVRCYFQKGQSFFNLVFSIVTLIIKQTNQITSKCLFRPMHCYIIDVLLVMSSQHRFP